MHASPAARNRSVISAVQVRLASPQILFKHKAGRVVGLTVKQTLTRDTFNVLRPDKTFALDWALIIRN